MRRLRHALIAAFLAVALAAAAVPTPESHFGFKIGTDKTVLDWSKVVSYFQALEKNSDRLRVKVLGNSTEGRPFILVTISSAANIKNLDHIMQVQQKLADPRRISSDAEAEKLIAEGKSIVLITCSIHATELAATHAAVELAYQLLTEDNPKFRAILDNDIFLLVPSLNPDGLDMVSDWYRKTLGTPREGSAPPQLYQKYTGHDNNRDWYFFTQAETRLTVAGVQNVWHPMVVYDMHQQGPNASRMFVPPWMDPVEPNIDPILAQECNSVGMGMALDLTAAGKTGVAVNAIYDFWTPARHYQAYHGGLRILTEAASARLATPVTIKPDQIAAQALGYSPRERSWNYLEPWMGGEWHLADIIDYELIAMKSLLYQFATRREDMVRNFYNIGKHQVARTSPAAFVLPAVERDPGAAQKLLDTLSFGMVEIEQAGAAFEAGGRQYPAGSYVIRMQQPYSGFAKTLLEKQNYPDLRMYPGGPPKRPYDVTAHTLPMLMGVEAYAVETPVNVPLKPVKEFRFRMEQAPAAGVLPASDSATWREANRVWKSGGALYRDPATGDLHKTNGAGLVAVNKPRIALFQPATGNADEGWTRWVLEDFGFEYTSLPAEEIQKGNLRSRFDAIMFAEQSAGSLANGGGERGGEEGGGGPAQSGGLGETGAAALKQFASEGGTILFFNTATEYAIRQLGVNLKNVVPMGRQASQAFYSPGSLLNVKLEGKSPLAFGMPAEFTIWSQGSPAWDVPDGSGAQVVARYPQSGVLASGWLLGENVLAGKAALVDYPMGTGHIVLFGMKPQYRAQSWQTFKLIFNAFLPR
jgi:hypothetical protein